MLLQAQKRNVLQRSKNITPGTEKRTLKAREKIFTPKERGTKKFTAHTAHRAPTPPKALVKKDLKKQPLFLYIISTTIKSRIPIV